jgi:hypothetical protein
MRFGEKLDFECQAPPVLDDAPSPVFGGEVLGGAALSALRKALSFFFEGFSP